MRNKLILILGFVFLNPILAHSYYSEEQFRMDIMDSIRQKNIKQEQQNIINSGNINYQHAFDTYNKSVNTLDKELEYRLKEIEIKQDDIKREEEWQKRKALIDKEFELNQREKALKNQENLNTKSGVGSDIDWEQAIKEAEQAAEKVRVSNKKSNLPVYKPQPSGEIGKYIEDKNQVTKENNIPIKQEKVTIFSRIKERTIFVSNNIIPKINPFYWISKIK